MGNFNVKGNIKSEGSIKSISTGQWGTGLITEHEDGNKWEFLIEDSPYKLFISPDNGSNLMTLTTDSKLGIGIDEPDSTLHIKGSGMRLEADASTDYMIISREETYGNIQTYNSEPLVLNSAGNKVSVNSTNPVGSFEVIGEHTITGANSTSDSTNKYFRISQLHYDTDEETAMLIMGYTDTDENRVYIGGGSSYNNAATSIDFWTASNNTTTTGTKRMTIDSDGNTGIGIDSPSQKLHVYADSGTLYSLIESASLSDGQAVILRAAGKKSGGSDRYANLGVRYNSGSGSNEGCGYMALSKSTSTSNQIYTWFDDSGNYRLSTSASDIGTTSGTVIGTQTSDKRLKNDLGECDYSLKEILKLETHKFNFKNDQTKINYIGFYAQEVADIIPEAVYDTKEKIDESDETKLAMDYTQIIPVLVNAIKDQQKEIEILKNKLGV